MLENSTTRQKRSTYEVNIAPLIDVVFILLIFFMVTTTFVRDANIDIERPSSKTAEKNKSRSVRISVGNRGELFVDAQPVKSWMLQTRLRAMNAEKLIKKVILIADRRVTTERLVEIVDECRLAGFKDIGLAVESKY